MARVELPVVVLNPSTGLPVNGASVAITNRATSAAATWYSAETGGTASTASVVTDTSGRGTAWLPRGAYLLTISGAGLTTYTEPWDAVPGADLSGDTLWLPDASVTNPKLASGLDAGKITTGTLPGAVLANVPGSALQNGTVTVPKMATGVGSRLLSSIALTNFTVTGITNTNLVANTAVTHNNKTTLALVLHSIRVDAGTTATMRVFLDDVELGNKAYVFTSSAQFALSAFTLTSGTLSGSHNWRVRAEGNTAGVNVIGDGSGVLLLFEQY